MSKFPFGAFQIGHESPYVLIASTTDIQTLSELAVSDCAFTTSPDSITIFEPPSMSSKDPPLTIGAFLIM